MCVTASTIKLRERTRKVKSTLTAVEFLLCTIFYACVSFKLDTRCKSIYEERQIKKKQKLGQGYITLKNFIPKI